MLSWDALQHGSSFSSKIDSSLQSITVDVVSEIEKDLQVSPSDVTSLVFLLYDVPDTALQRLIAYQIVSKELHSTNLNLLQEWAHLVKSKPTWKHEFLEALLICQLFGIVKKLGLDVSSLKTYYQPDNIFENRYVNPTKKVLYKLCENIDKDNLYKLQRTLLTFDIDTEGYESCELIFLKLMSEKVISINEIDKGIGYRFNFDKLVKILLKLPGLESFANELIILQNKNNGDQNNAEPFASSPLPSSNNAMTKDGDVKPEHFSDVLNSLSKLDLSDLTLVSDSQKLNKDVYPIKNPSKVGVCLIINQKDFYLCDRSIEDEGLRQALDTRKGSTADVEKLNKTMTMFKFKVIIGQNLGHKKLIPFIKHNIRQWVQKSDSIFMLCILSHGINGYVYAADCVKVAFEDILNIFDTDDASMLRGMPKVLIIQACRIEDESKMPLVADSPAFTTYKSIAKKSDLLTYWATSVGLKAFRDEKSGSIFLHYLCQLLQKFGKTESLYDIFTEVNKKVIQECLRHCSPQVSTFESSLTKHIYLYRPSP